MDFDKAVIVAVKRIDGAITKAKDVRRNYLAAVKKTRAFLARCGKVGYNRVAIGVSDKRLPESQSYPFSLSGMVFAWASGKEYDAQPCKPDSWPAIWHICEKSGIVSGCGNRHSHQADTDGLVDGVYECRKGVWHRIETDEA